MAARGRSGWGEFAEQKSSTERQRRRESTEDSIKTGCSLRNLSASVSLCLCVSVSLCLCVSVVGVSCRFQEQSLWVARQDEGGAEAALRAVAEQQFAAVDQGDFFLDCFRD